MTARRIVTPDYAFFSRGKPRAGVDLPGRTVHRSIHFACEWHKLAYTRGIVCKGGYDMGLTKPINALMVCFAFAFIGALIVGVIP
jgi:hypothetical protein